MFDSLHADEVRFPREPKMCEFCGKSFVRLVPMQRFKSLTILVTAERYCEKHRQPHDVLIGIGGSDMSEFHSKWSH